MDFEVLFEVMDVAEDEEQSVEIEGYTGKWSAFEKLITENATYYIYENDRYGDSTWYLVVGYADGMPIEVYETYDNIIQCLMDEEIIEEP